MIRSTHSIVAILSLLVAAVAFGQTTTPSGFVISSSVTGGGSNGTFSVTGADAPASAGLVDAATYSLNVDAGSDILLFDVRTIVSSGTLYNYDEVPGIGSDTNPPLGPLFAIYGGLSADTWYTTPNPNTSAAGTGTVDSIGSLVTHFDTTDDGPQTDFQFGQVTLVADANGTARARILGTMQTAAEPTPIFDYFELTLLIGDAPVVDVLGCTDPTALNFNPLATMDDGSCAFPPPEPITFGTALNNSSSALFYINDIINNSNIIDTLDDPMAYPDGATIFAPNNDALEPLIDFDPNAPDLSVIDVEDLIFTPAWSDTDLGDLVPDTGDTATLAALNGSAYVLENGLTFGGVNIISSVETDNGWLHVLDGVPNPVPEPGSLPLMMFVGLLGLMNSRRRR